MSTTVLDNLRAERDEARSAAVAMAESDGFDPEDKTYVDLKTRATTLDKRVGELSNLIEARSASDVLDAKMAKAAQRRANGTDDASLEQRGSIGARFVSSDVFTEYRGRGSSAQFHVDHGEVQTRALPTGLAELVAAGVEGPKQSLDLTPPPAPTPLLDNISRVQVSGNAIEYVAWSKIAGGAAVVAEKGPKPSAEFGPSVTADTLDNIAVYTQLTRQLVEDRAAVRSMIDQELVRDVAREEEAQAAAALAAATLPTATGDTLRNGIRVGMGEVSDAGYSSNAVLLNPADYAALDIGASGLNYAQSPTWGLTPIPSGAQAAGTATVGDFRTAITQFFRSAISLYITDSHGDTFLANVFTLLAERRSLTAVVRPQALVEVTVSAGV